jgi:hypothetical protein
MFYDIINQENNKFFPQKTAMVILLFAYVTKHSVHFLTEISTKDVKKNKISVGK